jgi:hypothetical protein
MESIMTANEVVIRNKRAMTTWKEDTSRSGYVTIEEMRSLLHEMVKKVYEDDTI